MTSVSDANYPDSLPTTIRSLQQLKHWAGAGWAGGNSACQHIMHTTPADKNEGLFCSCLDSNEWLLMKGGLNPVS